MFDEFPPQGLSDTTEFYRQVDAAEQLIESGLESEVRIGLLDQGASDEYVDAVIERVKTGKPQDWEKSAMKYAGYREPEDLPIPFSATDPYEAELFFDFEDPCDELRDKENFEQPVGDGEYRMNKDAAATKTQLDRRSREIQQSVPEHLGQRFRRFIARSQAAMEMGVEKTQMLDWFYNGRDDVDPFRMAAAGYPSEARWLAAESESQTTREIYNEEAEAQEAFVPDFLADSGAEEAQDTELETVDSISPDGTEDYSSDHWFDDTPDNMFELPDGSGAMTGEVGAEPIAAKRATIVNGDDRDYDWLMRTAQQNVLQQNDMVETADGRQGTISEVQTDGSFTVQMNNGGSTQSITYNKDALEQGEVKRQEGGGSMAPTSTSYASVKTASEWSVEEIEEEQMMHRNFIRDSTEG